MREGRLLLKVLREIRKNTKPNRSKTDEMKRAIQRIQNMKALFFNLELMNIFEIRGLPRKRRRGRGIKERIIHMIQPSQSSSHICQLQKTKIGHFHRSGKATEPSPLLHYDKIKISWIICEIKRMAVPNHCFNSRAYGNIVGFAKGRAGAPCVTKVIKAGTI